MRMTLPFMLVAQIWKILTTGLEQYSLLAIEWFQVNYMKLNKLKCHLLMDTSMNCCGQTSEGVRFGKVKTKIFLELG